MRTLISRSLAKVMDVSRVISFKGDHRAVRKLYITNRRYETEKTLTRLLQSRKQYNTANSMNNAAIKLQYLLEPLRLVVTE